MAKPPQRSEVERLVRYCHPAKILGTTRLPGLDTLDDAALAGVSPERYRDIVRSIRSEAERSARELRTPPLRERLLALGDSHTDDLASWAELVALATGAPVVNAGLSGDSSTAALARVWRLSPAAHAIVLLGTNDARRHDGGPMLVSHRETRRNLRAIDATLRRRCDRVTWITPPPVDEKRIMSDPGLAEARMTWRHHEVAAKAAIVRDEWPDAIDIWPAFGAEHLAPDGLHPSAAGQRLIAERVLRRIG